MMKKTMRKKRRKMKNKNMMNYDQTYSISIS
jgi:hypothetical protein